jgi:hypothetical protein
MTEYFYEKKPAEGVIRMELLKGIINRLGIILHWLGFIFFIFCCLLLIMSQFNETGNPLWLRTIVLLPYGFIFWIGGWVIKFLLTGKKDFLPWN